MAWGIDRLKRIFNVDGPKDRVDEIVGRLGPGMSAEDVAEAKKITRPYLPGETEGGVARKPVRQGTVRKGGR